MKELEPFELQRGYSANARVATRPTDEPSAYSCEKPSDRGVRMKPAEQSRRARRYVTHTRGVPIVRADLGTRC